MTAVSPQIQTAMTHPAIEVQESPPLSELVNRASTNQEIITLTTNGQGKAVLLSVEAFQSLLRIRSKEQDPRMPLTEFHPQFHAALVEAGYDSREKIINLVQAVKQEIADECE